jgi:hypothetical protein
MATPTPRAMSPDVVRIYVPPAPPEETGGKISQTPTSSESTNTVKDFKHTSPATTSPIKDTTPPEILKFITTEADVTTPASRNGRSSAMSRHSGVLVTGGTEEESLCYSSDYGFMNGEGKAPSSSSRRGSMSRKSPSPMFEKDFIIECSHLKSKTTASSKHTSPTSPPALTAVTPDDFQHSIDRDYDEIIDPNKVFRVISTSHTSSVENLSLTSPPPRFSSFSGSLRSPTHSNNNNQSNPNLSNLSLNKGFKGQQIYQSNRSLSNGSLHHEPSPVASHPASPKIYTSFEELAKSNKLRKEKLHEQKPNRMPVTQSMNRMPLTATSPDAYKNQQNAKHTKCPSDEEKYSLYYSRPYTHPKKGQSDYSIQYNAMLSSHQPGTDSDIEYKAMRKLRKTSAGGGGSGSESSPYDYEMLSSSDGRESGGRVKAKNNSFKQYSRFFNTDYDAANDDDEEEEEGVGEYDEDQSDTEEGDEENGRVRLIQNKSSDESSSSPKSPQTTPMNEAIPLLSPDLKPSGSGRHRQQQVAQSFQSR